MELSCSEKSFLNKIVKLNKQISQFTRNRSKKLDELLNKEFSPPILETNLERSLNSSETEKEKELKVQLKTVKDENKVLKRKVLSSEVIVQEYERQVEEIRSLCSQLNVSMKDKDCLRKDIHDIKEKYSIVEAKLVNVELELKSKTKEASNTLRNLKKKIKCRDEKLV